MKAPTLGHRVEYALVQMVGALVRFLPERLALALGAGLGMVAGGAFRIRRAVVAENLERAFPDRPAPWRRRVAAASYRHLGREGVALLRLAGMSPSELRERTEVVGIEHVQAPLEAGRGVVIATGHLGNWEIGGASLAVRGVPLDVVARTQSNPLFDRRLNGIREALGMTVIPRSEAPRRVLRALRTPRAVALVADQNVRRGGVFVDFFGVPASTARGPVLLADRAGAASVLAVVHRLPGARASYRLTLSPLPDPPENEPEESFEGDEAAGETGLAARTRAYLAGLEEGIRTAPEQYFWPHRRWKTRPEEQQPDRPVQG